MDLFSMIFAVLAIAAAVAASIFVGIGTGIFGALAFVVLLVVLYRIGTHQSGPDRLSRGSLNAFQQALADDDAPGISPGTPAPPAPNPLTTRARGGRRNRSWRKHMARKA